MADPLLEALFSSGLTSFDMESFVEVTPPFTFDSSLLLPDVKHEKEDDIEVVGEVKQKPPGEPRISVTTLSPASTSIPAPSTSLLLNYVQNHSFHYTTPASTPPIKLAPTSTLLKIKPQIKTTPLLSVPLDPFSTSTSQGIVRLQSNSLLRQPQGMGSLNAKCNPLKRPNTNQLNFKASLSDLERKVAQTKQTSSYTAIDSPKESIPKAPLLQTKPKGRQRDPLSSTPSNGSQASMIKYGMQDTPALRETLPSTLTKHDMQGSGATKQETLSTTPSMTKYGMFGGTLLQDATPSTHSMANYGIFGGTIMSLLSVGSNTEVQPPPASFVVQVA